MNKNTASVVKLGIAYIVSGLTITFSVHMLAESNGPDSYPGDNYIEQQYAYHDAPVNYITCKGEMFYIGDNLTTDEQAAAEKEISKNC